MKGGGGERRHDSKEDPIWILLHGVRHNKHGRWVALLLALSWSASSYPVRNPSPTLFRLALPREVDLRRSATPRSSAPLREREEKTERERERELCACVTFARGVARFVKKGEWWGREGGPAPGPRGHRTACVPPLCGSCTSRLCFSLYSPPTPPVASREYTDGHYSDRARSIFSLAQPHVQHTHTTHTYPACNELLENPEGKRSDIQNIVKSDISFFSFSS